MGEGPTVCEGAAKKEPEGDRDAQAREDKARRDGARLVLRTANGSSVHFAEFVGLAAFKPPTDFCRRVRVPGQALEGLGSFAGLGCLRTSQSDVTP